MSNFSRADGGIGFIGLLQFGLIILRLCSVIQWSWLWVLSPTWITILWFIVLFAFACAFSDRR